VLLSILARVHTRQDTFLLGNVSLNLTGVSCLQARHLSKFLSAILPFLAHVPVTIDTLETKRFSPRKNYDTNLLETGLLQVADGTFFLLDETVMKEGQLKGEGIAAIKAIATLIEQQAVEYDFQYYQQSFPVNAGVLVTSDGRSMFKNTLHLPVRQSGPAPAAFDEQKFAQVLADGELLGQFRRYVLLLSTFSDKSLAQYAIPTAVSEHAQAVFVAVRQAEAASGGELRTNADTFHQWLTHARLLAVSQGSLELSQALFDRARQMEAERLSRLATKP